MSHRLCDILQLFPFKENIDRLSTNVDAAKFFLKPEFKPSEIARSLLAFDLKLFQNIIPFHLLNGIYSRMNKNCTVRPCIEQFNAVDHVIHVRFI